MKQWYEVFNETECCGTQTVAICATLDEAIEEMKKRNALYHVAHYIDKWEDADNPRIIRDTELEKALSV